MKDEAQKDLAFLGIQAGERWLHYKGGFYRIVVLAVKEDTLEPCVVYRSEEQGTVWIRTFANWSERVNPTRSNPNGMPRFVRTELAKTWDDNQPDPEPFL